MKNCLLLVDIQNDYFPEGKIELVGMNIAAQNARLILEKFWEKRDLIIHIQHISIRAGATFFLPESKGVEINSLVSPKSNETIIKKNFPNSFRDTDLLEFLQEKILILSQSVVQWAICALTQRQEQHLISVLSALFQTMLVLHETSYFKEKL